MKKGLFSGALTGLDEWDFSTTRGQWRLSAGLLLNHGEGTWTRTHSSKSGHLVTADPTVRTPSSASTVLFLYPPPLPLNGSVVKEKKQALLTLMCWFVHQIISVRCWLIMFLVMRIVCVLVVFNLFFPSFCLAYDHFSASAVTRR